MWTLPPRGKGRWALVWWWCEEKSGCGRAVLRLSVAWGLSAVGRFCVCLWSACTLALHTSHCAALHTSRLTHHIPHTHTSTLHTPHSTLHALRACTARAAEALLCDCAALCGAGLASVCCCGRALAKKGRRRVAWRPCCYRVAGRPRPVAAEVENYHFYYRVAACSCRARVAASGHVNYHFCYRVAVCSCLGRACGGMSRHGAVFCVEF